MSDTTTTNGANRMSGNPVFNEQQMMRLEAIINAQTMSRSALFQRLFDQRRDLNAECGYPETANFDARRYRELYDREPIATRVVQLMPKECWAVQPLVYEDDSSDNITEFERAWDDLGKTLRGQCSWYSQEEGSPVYEYLKRLDEISGIGHFGVLLLGIDDGKPMYEPAEGVVSLEPTGDLGKQIVGNAGPTIRQYVMNRGSVKTPIPEDKELWRTVKSDDPNKEDRVIPRHATFNVVKASEFTSKLGTDAQYLGVQLGPTEYPAVEPSKECHKLLYMRVFDESMVQIVQYEANTKNPRFGQPVMYRITLNDENNPGSGVGLTVSTIMVHWSRVIHVAENKLPGSETFGAPRMRPVLNPILDIRKVRGSSAEGFWRSCFSFLSLETHPSLGGDVDIDRSLMRDEIEKMMNGLDRSAITTGMTLKTIAPSVTDPTSQNNIQIEAICIQLGCPVPVFKGYEIGEQASEENKTQWNDRIRQRQVGHITPNILIPFIDRLIQMGVLPEPCAPKQQAPNTEEVSSDTGEELEGQDQEQETEEVVSNFDFPPKKGKVVQEDQEEPTDNPFSTDSKQLPQETQAPEKTGYSIEWPDLDSMSAMAKAQVAAAKINALSQYVSGGAEAMISPKDFWVQFMGLTEEQADAIICNAEDHQVITEQQNAEQQVADMELKSKMIDDGLIADPTDPDLVPEVAPAGANPFAKGGPPGVAGKKPNPFAKGGVK